MNFTVPAPTTFLKVANAALRYRPSDKNPEEIQRLLTSLSGEVSADTRRPPSPGSGTVSASHEGPQAVPATVAGRGMDQAAAGEAGREAKAPAAHRSVRERSWQGRSGGRSGGGAQAVIGPSKTDIYGINAGMKIRFPQAEESRPVPGMIWVLDSAGQPQPRRVRLGITNGRETALVGGDLKEGDTVITGELGDEEAGAQQRGNTGSPFGGGRTPFGGGGGGGGRRGGGR